MMKRVASSKYQVSSYYSKWQMANNLGNDKSLNDNWRIL